MATSSLQSKRADFGKTARGIKHGVGETGGGNNEPRVFEMGGVRGRDGWGSKRVGYGVETAGRGFSNTSGFVFGRVGLLGTACGSLSSRTMAWGSLGAGVSFLTSWGQEMTGVAISDDVESFWAAGDVATAGTVVLDTVERQEAGASESERSGAF